MRRLYYAAPALLVLMLLGSTALANDVISVDVEVGTHFGDAGELIQVATVDTGPGLNCFGSVDPNNPESEHDNTDVVFVSGDAGGTIFDVEVPTFDPDQMIAFVSEGPTKIFFRIGDDGVISAGFVAMLDCHESEEETTTTTTVAVETTTTTVPVPDTTTTTHVDPPPTTITAPPPGCPQDPTTPCGPVDAGGGSMAAALVDGLPTGGVGRAFLIGGAVLFFLALLVGAVGYFMQKPE